MGADAIRWLGASQAFAQPLRFGLNRAEEVHGWLRTLWNVYHFFATYANVDRWPQPGAMLFEADAPSAAPLDRWLRARFAATAHQVSAALESFNPAQATSALLALLDDLSNWWVRRSRRRFWKGGAGADKQIAYHALHSALLTFTRLLAPFVPFTAEALYQRLAAPFGDQLPQSVHLCSFPIEDAAPEDGALVEECAFARRIIGLGRTARAQAGIRVRQPLARAFVFAPGSDRQAALTYFEQDVLEELNIKCVEFVEQKEQLDGAFADDAGLAVGLDTRLDDALVLEGIARDLVRHIQTLRKNAGLRVDDRIHLWIEACGEDEIGRVVSAHSAYILAEALAVTLNSGSVPAPAFKAEPKVSGHPARVALVKADRAAE
jgi:isoleucyl-tRNA synthetase